MQVALPIEYGALNVCSVMAGLLFYDEAQYMSRWQLGLVLGGTGIVMLGIAMSLRSTLRAVDMTHRGSIHIDTPRDNLGNAPRDSFGRSVIGDREASAAAQGLPAGDVIIWGRGTVWRA